MSKKYKRISKKEFIYIFKEGKTVKNSFFFIKYHPNPLTHDRWSVVIPKKISKKSTQRNKLKRKITESIKKIKPLSLPTDAILFASEPILDKSQNEIKGFIEEAINQINVNFEKERRINQ